MRQANQLVCVCLIECSLAPIFCSDLLMVCHTTYRAITMQQHPLACILDIESVNKTHQLVCICLVECSLPPIFCSNLLMVCHTTYRAIPTQQHPLACILD